MSETAATVWMRCPSSEMVTLVSGLKHRVTVHTSHHHAFLFQQLVQWYETAVHHCLGAACIQHYVPHLLSVDRTTPLNALPQFSSRSIQRILRAEPRHVSLFLAVVALHVHPVPLIRPLSTNSAHRYKCSTCISIL